MTLRTHSSPESWAAPGIPGELGFTTAGAVPCGSDNQHQRGRYQQCSHLQLFPRAQERERGSFLRGTEGWKDVGGCQQERAGWHPEEVGVVREERTNWDSGEVKFGIWRCSWPAGDNFPNLGKCPLLLTRAQVFLMSFIVGIWLQFQVDSPLSSGHPHPTSQISFWKSLLINLLAGSCLHWELSLKSHALFENLCRFLSLLPFFQVYANVKILFEMVSLWCGGMGGSCLSLACCT